ncbi:MAG TPA: S8 family serine peptidase [Streptosporangiaceae bacterium]|nr:S8 family serine peptidase [Streptosporangiaceae bacterium]
MRRIAVALVGVALMAAAPPATAATGSARSLRAPAAAKPSPRPTAKPSAKTPPRRPHPTAPAVPVPVATEPRPTRNCPGLQVSSRVGSVPWAQQALDFSSAWPLTEGRGVKVAVVDSGVDYSPQLAGRVTAVDLTRTGFQDCVGHGTEVAAIIGASDLQAQGVPFEGVAPAATILSVKVNSIDSGSSATLAQGIKDAALLGANVINVSVQTANSPALRAAVAFALSKDAVVVAAGGNDGDDAGGISGSGPFFPASYPGVLSVGAVESDGSLAPFSDLRSHVAVTAPGANVTSACPGGYQDNDLNGTSYATAFVSGVAALVRARFPRLDEAAVVARITGTANGAAGPGTGDGLVNPLQAVTAVTVPGAAPGPSPTARPGPVSVSRAPPPDVAADRVALEVTAGSIGVAALVALAAIVVRQGQRRRWRAGRAEAPAEGRAAGELWPAD